MRKIGMAEREILKLAKSCTHSHTRIVFVVFSSTSRSVEGVKGAKEHEDGRETTADVKIESNLKYEINYKWKVGLVTQFIQN